MAIACRQHALRPTWMEIFFHKDPLVRGLTGNELKKDVSAFFTFQNTQQCDTTISTFLKQLGVHIFCSMGNRVRLIHLSQINHVSPSSSYHDFKPLMGSVDGWMEITDVGG